MHIWVPVWHTGLPVPVVWVATLIWFIRVLRCRLVKEGSLFSLFLLRTGRLWKVILLLLFLQYLSMTGLKELTLSFVIFQYLVFHFLLHRFENRSQYFWGIGLFVFIITFLLLINFSFFRFSLNFLHFSRFEWVQWLKCLLEILQIIAKFLNLWYQVRWHFDRLD